MRVTLTESQFNRFIKESVKRYLNEVRVNVNGKERDLHGTNANDWAYMAKARADKSLKPIAQEIQNDAQQGYEDFNRRARAGQLTDQEKEELRTTGQFHTPREQELQRKFDNKAQEVSQNKSFKKDLDNFASMGGTPKSFASVFSGNDIDDDQLSSSQDVMSSLESLGNDNEVEDFNPQSADNDSWADDILGSVNDMDDPDEY